MISDTDLSLPEPLTWSALRRPETLNESVLSERAASWLQSMAYDVRPILLAQEFPRIVNRLAGLAADAVAVRIALDDLLTDSRGGRQGFSPLVQEELQRLHDHIQASSSSGVAR